VESKNKNSKLSDFPKYDQNPYICKIKLRQHEENYTGKQINVDFINLDGKTRKIGSGFFKLESPYLDKTPFLRIYKPALIRLPRLSQSGLKIFSILFDELEFNSSKIYIFKDDILEKCGWNTDKPYYQGIASLVENEFFACSHSPNIYFINPTMIFKGDRTTLLKDD
jgi:hypothetical protein